MTSKYSESTGLKIKLRKKHQVGEEVGVGKSKAGGWTWPATLACEVQQMWPWGSWSPS